MNNVDLLVRIKRPGYTRLVPKSVRAAVLSALERATFVDPEVEISPVRHVTVDCVAPLGSRVWVECGPLSVAITTESGGDAVDFVTTASQIHAWEKELQS